MPDMSNVMLLPQVAAPSTRKTKFAVDVPPPEAMVPYAPGFPERIVAPTAEPALTARLATVLVALDVPVFFIRTVTCQSSPGSTTPSPSPQTCVRPASGLKEASYWT